MPYQLITDAHIRDLLQRGEAEAGEDGEVVYAGVRWARIGDVWVQGQPARRSAGPRPWETDSSDGSGGSAAADDGAGEPAKAAEQTSSGPSSGLAAGRWRRPVICVATGFVVTLLALSLLVSQRGGLTVRSPDGAVSAPLPPPPAPGSDLPTPSGPSSPASPDAGTDRRDEAGDGEDVGPVAPPEPQPPAEPAGQDRNPPTPTVIEANRPTDVPPRPQDPRDALAAVGRQIDRAAADGDISLVGRLVLRGHVRKLDRTLTGGTLLGGLGSREQSLDAGIDGLRRSVSTLILFGRIDPQATASIRSAVDEFERTLR